MLSAKRDLRQPPGQKAFDAIAIPVSALGAWAVPTWYRLCRVEFPGQFFPSKGSRLTPASGDFPCVYLATDQETTVAEVWGDRFAAHRPVASSSPYVISREQAERWAFLETGPLPADLRLCDLTDAHTRLAVGMDAGSLYAPDLRLPQRWAERIARHPARLDGIAYRSRHTDQICLVLWSRAEDAVPLEQRLSFRPAGDFFDSAAAYAMAGKAGVRLAFAW